MPSARPSNFKGSGGILRDKDATIVGLQFTDENPLFNEPRKPGGFHSLFGVLQVLEDGKTEAIPQPVWVGGFDDFGITDDGMGLTGDNALSKSSSWYVFVDSLVNPGGVKGSGFDEANFPDDDPNVADYSAIVGARVRFNWQKNEKATKKYGVKKSKNDPKKTFDREDLIVTAYYGQVDVSTLAAPAKAIGVGSKQPAGGAKPLGTKKLKPAEIAERAAEAVQTVLAEAKKPMSRSKVSVKLLTLLGTETPEMRTAVRTWVEDNDNVAGIAGVEFDAKTEMLALEA